MTFTISNPPAGAVPLTVQQWSDLIGGEPRDVYGEIETVGPWSIPVRFRALAVSSTWGELSRRTSLTIVGERTMHHPKESGYQLEGRVSVGGRKFRAFTSSELFELPDGRLFNVATLEVCK